MARPSGSAQSRAYGGAVAPPPLGGVQQGVADKVKKRNSTVRTNQDAANQNLRGSKTNGQYYGSGKRGAQSTVRTPQEAAANNKKLSGTTKGGGRSKRGGRPASSS